MAAIKEGSDNYEQFDPYEYNRHRYGVPGEQDFLFTCLARHYCVTMSSAAPNSLKVLDYGCGPSIGLSISAASKASELVLADIAEVNRKYVQKWLKKDPAICNFWSPHFQYVTRTLEGGSEKDAVEREEMLRDRIKAVVSCDIMKDAFIEDAYNQKAAYDVVFSSLCLEAGCQDLTSYKKGVAKLASLIKEGDYLLLCSTRREHAERGYYIVKNVKYSDIPLKKDFITATLQENGFRITNEEYFPLPPEDDSNCDGLLFFAACKCAGVT